MHFSTLAFAVFFAFTLSIHWLIRRERLAQKLFLLAASYFFYGLWNWRALLLLIGSSVFNYAVGEALNRCPAPARRRLLLAAGVAGNLGLLGWFKYYDFFRASLDDFLGLFALRSHLPVLEILLPVGISFWTFQALAYVFDRYRGRYTGPVSFLDFLLFQGFFPKLLMGPICRAEDLIPQLLGEAPARVPDFSRAATLILSGLLKKAVLATHLDTHLVSAAFLAPQNYSGPALWVAMYAYTFLIYFDFSGYTDLALGIALLLGFHLPDNFNHPYVATNIGEFWRRWHITFSNWLRDYIYFPLGGSRRGKLRAYFNLFVTMIVCGLWHGAAWKYVIWGAIHGVALASHKAGCDLKRALGGDPRVPDPWWRQVLGWGYTFHVCCFARVFFRSPDLERAGVYLQRMFSPGAAGLGFEAGLLGLLAVSLLLQFIGPRLRGLYIKLGEWMPFAARPVFWFATGMLLLALKPAGIAPYIYFGF